MTMLSWPAWGTTAHLSVSDPAGLQAAQRLARSMFARSEKSADRRNPHAEIHRLDRSAGYPVRVSRRLAAMIAASLDAARASGGLVDPTVGNAVVLAEASTRRLASSPQRTSLLPVCSGAVPPVSRPAIGWQSVDLDGRYVTAPPGVLLDITALAKAITVQHCADLIGHRLGVGVMVGLGGDLAAGGPAPESGWQVPGRLGPLGSGAGLAQIERPVIDPRTGRPAPQVWTSVAVCRSRAEGGVVAAKTLAVAAAVIGPAASLYLDDRLVPRTGDVTGSGPVPPPVHLRPAG
jgi:thiamine biosynthesis lipoprotein